MNWLKKITAIVLMFAVVISGLYIVETKSVGKEVQAAESEVSTDMLQVKVQIATDGSNYMRFTSSVDSLEYQSVGFEVTPKGGSKKTYTTQTVYERIASTDQNIAYTFSPKVVDTASEYFVTAKLKATAGVDYTVRAFAVTLGGETVYGQSRCVAVSDGQIDSPLNLTFESSETIAVGDELYVTYGASNTATTAEVIAVDGSTVHVRVDVDKESLPSATKFTFGTAGSVIYRNLYTKYTGGTTYDTTWYDVYAAEDTTETAFVAATNADVYGLAQIVNGGNSLLGKSVYLVSDVALNADESTAYNWTPIGNASTAFEGTFDGQMHEIQNLYIKASSQKIGLFGQTGTKSTLSNFSLKDGTIISEYTEGHAQAGSIAGVLSGNMNNVYSDADVSTNKNEVGGLVGRLDGATTHDIRECWFDGNVTVSNGIDIGGIIGRVHLGHTVIKDCLNTGAISNTYVASDGIAYAGGLLGRIHSDVSGADMTTRMEDCLNAGTVTTAVGAGVGPVVGRARKTVTIVNVYTTDSATNTNGTVAVNDTVVGVGNYSTNGNIVVGACTIRANDTLLGAQGRYHTSFDFYLGANDDGVWVARSGKTPALKNFIDEAQWYVADETIVADTSWYEEGKTAFLISTAAQLVGLSEKSQTVDFADTTITLGADIVLNSGNATNWKESAPKNAWNPIGYTKTFAGSIYGEGHAIRGMYINTANNYVGFVGRMTQNASVKDLRIENSYVNSTHAYAQAGSVVGQPAGMLSNIYSDAIVNTTGSYTGGMFGRSISDVTFENCWYDGTFTAYGKTNGGILGSVSQNKAIFNNCLNTGELICAFGPNQYPHFGGMIGATEGTASFVLNQCLNTGTLQATGFTLIDGSTIGAIIGYMPANTTGAVNHVYYTAESFSRGLTGNTAGMITGTSTKFTNALFTKLSESDVVGETAKSKLTGFDFTNQWTVVNEDVATPQITKEQEIHANDLIMADTSWYTANPNATEFVIKTPAQLMGLEEVVKTDNLSGHTVKLGADIVFNEGDARAWRAYAPLQRFNTIGKTTQFWGTFDGQGHSISGIYINENTAITGLFGNMSGTVQNLRLENSYVNCTLNAADTMVGSVAGFCTGTLTTVYSNAVVESANEEVGGLVGRFGATYTKTISKCWFDGAVYGHNLYAGGIVGQVNMGNKTISDCLFTGTVNNDWTSTNYPHTGGITGGVYYTKPNDSTVATTLNLKNCLSIGTMKVKGTSTVGAVIGRYANGSGTTVTYGTIENTYFTADVYSTALSTNSSGTITGTTTKIVESHFTKIDNSEIIGSAATTTLSGFDFSNVWAITSESTPIIKYFAK